MTSPNLLEHLHLAGVRVEFVPVQDAASHRGPPPCWLVVRPYGVPTFGSLFAALPRQLLRQLDRGHVRILVDYAHEGYTGWMLERIYEALSYQSDVAPDALVLVSGDERATETHRSFAQERRLHARIDVRSVNYFGAAVAERGRATLPISPSRGAATAFLSLNRRPRIHRLLLVSRVVRSGLLPRARVSLPRVFEGRTNWDVLEADGARLGVPPQFRRELAIWYGELDGVLPFVVDTPDMTPNLAYSYGPAPYASTKLSIVTESLFFEGVDRHVFVSEKVYKPLLFGHPMVVVGDPGTLDLLRRQGFETWSSFVDEQYDAVEGRANRFDAAWDEIVRLGALAPNELDERLAAADTAIRHNIDSVRALRFPSNEVDFLFEPDAVLGADAAPSTGQDTLP